MYDLRLEVLWDAFRESYVGKWCETADKMIVLGVAGLIAVVMIVMLKACCCRKAETSCRREEFEPARSEDELAWLKAKAEEHEEKSVVLNNESKFFSFSDLLYCFEKTELDLRFVVGRENIASIKIPSNIETINANCFCDCKFLREVTFAKESKLKSIGKEIFQNRELVRVCIPASVESIGNDCFNGCRYLREVTFAKGSKLKTIGMHAFSQIPIAEICIPESVEIIGGGCFKECRSLSDVVFAEGSHLKTLEQSTFYGCISLSYIDIPASVERVCSYCFARCNSSLNVTFGEGSQIKEIEENVSGSKKGWMAYITMRVPTGTVADNKSDISFTYY